jgi:hypothetical protein
MASGSIPQYNGVKQWDEAATANALVGRDSSAGITVAAVACVGITQSGNLALSRAAKSSAYTAAAETVLEISGNTTITLPPAAGCTGRVYALKKTDTGTTTIIDGDGSETIDGATTKSSTVQYSCLVIQSNGTAWNTLASMGTWT